MKKILIFITLSVSMCFAKDSFISMCEKPTLSEEVTLKAMIDRRNYYYPQKKYQLNYNDIDICEKYYNEAKNNIGITIVNKEIINIYPFKYFTNVKRITLRGNKIKDITSLKYLHKLTELNMHIETVEKGVESLEKLPLKKLSLGISKSVDISPIGNINTLERIVISGGKNYYSLKNLKNLKSVMLNYLEINDLCKLNNFKSLKRLSLSRNNLKSLKCIGKFKNLTYLDIQNNHITDLSPLSQLDKLERLVLRDVPVEDISPLIKMKNLKVFYFSGTKIKYLSPLAQSKSIEFSEDSSERFFEEYFNRSLASCSPKSMREVRDGITCFEKDGSLKVFWKRWLGI